MTNPLRLGTGGSALAHARARAVAGRLGAEIVAAETQTADDAVSALRDALRAGDVDAIVHSYPAVPLGDVEGIAIAAVPKRGDARDAFCGPGGRALDAAPAGARIGADSALRRAQLRHRHPGLEAIPLEGSLDANVALLDAEGSARLDGVLASAAELERLERANGAIEHLALSEWPTAPAQGALVIETRTGEAKRVAKLDHRTSRLTTDAERGVLAQLLAADPALSATLAATALLDDGLLFLSARLYAPDGSRQLTSSHALYPEDSRDPAGELAARVAEELLAEGARELAPTGGRV